MQPAADALRPLLEATTFGAFAFPVVANVDARPNQDGPRARELLLRQIAGVVRWEETIRWMAAEGVTHALEIGPGKVLAGLVKRIEKSITVLPCGDLASIDAAAAALAAAQG
jgi:[acyl-carrier-protein] S-malonyltransferase